jgi:hypothetical protein
MKVYILIGYYVGVGYEIIEVYSTNKKADQAKSLNPKSSDGTSFAFFNIREYEIL